MRDLSVAQLFNDFFGCDANHSDDLHASHGDRRADGESVGRSLVLIKRVDGDQPGKPGNQYGAERLPQQLQQVQGAGKSHPAIVADEHLCGLVKEIARLLGEAQQRIEAGQQVAQ